MTYGSSWKPWRWVRIDLILSMGDVYINPNLNPLTQFTSSSRSTKFKDILLWNISQMITKTTPISTRIVKWNRTSHCEFDGKLMATKTTTWLEFPNGGKATMRITVWDPSRRVNHLSKIIWDRKTITQFTRSISSTRKGKTVLMMDVKVSKDKNIRRSVDQENLIYVRWNRIKNSAQRWRR